MKDYRYHYKAKVISVYDADTIKCEVFLGCGLKFEKKTCRLFGIDAPEMRGKERPRGIISRDAVRDLILNKEVTIRTKKDKSGKYGRLLVDVFVDQDGETIHINEWLIENNLALRANY